MPPKKKDDKKGAKKEDPADALANQLEGERQNLAVELAFQKEKLRLLREENVELHNTIEAMKAAAHSQAASADDVMTHNRREISHAVKRAADLEARVNELEAQLAERESEIADLHTERIANRRRLEERSAAVTERAMLEDVVKRQDEIIKKQEAEEERQATQIKELESQLSEATKTIAELQLRSSGKTNLAIFFGEPWLITRSRHRLYGELPADREEGTINHMGSKIIMYGGTSRAEGLVRDVYWFNLETKTWERTSSAGKQGPGRTRHVAAAVGKYKIVIFGGRRQQTVLSDVHILNADSIKWSSPTIKGAPEPCEGSACCTIREKVYMFGGVINDQLTAELSSFDTETGQWVPVPSYGSAPLPRKNHVMCSSEDGRYVWIFGGSDDNGPLNDLTVLDMDHQTWSAAIAAGGGPKPREMAVGTMAGKYFLVAGGTDGKHHRYHDVWALDTEEMVWEMLYDNTEAMLGSYTLKSRGQYHVFYGTSLYTLRPNRDELFDELEVVEFSLPSDIDALIRSKRAAESGPASKLELLEEPIAAGSNFLEVGWRAPVRALDKIDYFKLLMSSSSGVVKDVCQGKFDRFKVTGLRPSTEYVFCVKMVFDDGSHMWSESRAYSTRFGGSNVALGLTGGGATAKSKGMATGTLPALTAA